jgi:uncharacterized membrane protein
LALAIIMVAVILSALIPPMQSPDEPAHLGRAYLLSKGQILLDDAVEGPGGFVDDGLIRFMDIFFELGVRGKMDATLVNGVAPFLHWAHTSSHRAYTGTAYYFPGVYVPQAIALAAGKALNLSIEHSYQLARLAVFATTLMLIALSAVLIRPSPLALALLLTPMAIFQALSSTIDAISLALCMLSISCFMVLAKPGRQARDALLFGLLCVAIFVLASSRAYALPLLLLPFVVGWKKKSKAFLALSAVVAIATVGWTLFALATIHDDRVVRTLSTTSILEFYGSHPDNLARVLWDTLQAKYGFYTVSFIGQLGYLNVPLPRIYQTVAAGILVFLTLVSLNLRRSYDGESSARAILGLLAIPSCFLIFLAMLATWTPFGNRIIEGVQGRYFHIPALMVAYAIAGAQPWRNKVQITFGGIALIMFVVMGASVMVPALLDRYWTHDVAPTDAQESSDKNPLMMSAGSILSGSHLSPRSGDLYSVAVDLGTYYGRSNGTLSVEVCSTECRHGTINVAKASDNQLAYIELDQPLQIAQNAAMDVRLTRSADATHPLVVWGYPNRHNAVSSTLDGQDTGQVPRITFAIR